MKYFETYYAGIKGSIASNNASRKPLAFITPDGDDKAAEKRKETVDNWTYGWGDKDPKDITKVVDNKPMTGFQIVDWGRRWSTDNKVARIVDPRGYELEIYIPNLMHLILNCTIDKGMIAEELVWLRDGANNRLYPSDSKEYLEAKAMADKLVASGGKIVQPRHEVGDVVRDKWNNEMIYLGMKTVQWLGIAGENKNEKQVNGAWGRARITSKYIETTGEVLYGDTARFHCYFPLSQWQRRKEVICYTKQIKVDAILGKATPEQLAEVPTMDAATPVQVDKENFFQPETREWNRKFRDMHGYYAVHEQGYVFTNVARIIDALKFDDTEVDFDELKAFVLAENQKYRTLDWYRLEETA